MSQSKEKTGSDGKSTIERLREEYPEKLEELAESDLPAAPIADEILQEENDE